jgi:hypothetical protein
MNRLKINILINPKAKNNGKNSNRHKKILSHKDKLRNSIIQKKK